MRVCRNEKCVKKFDEINLMSEREAKRQKLGVSRKEKKSGSCWSIKMGGFSKISIDSRTKMCEK